MGLCVYNNIIFDIECGGHIKRAADANTVELAAKEMKTVVTYLEANGMTNGYTSILYDTPDQDVGFWYQNLKASLGELEKITPETTQLERSNILIKLRETLLDHGESVTVTKPNGISLYPNNIGYASFGLLSFVVAIFGMVVIIIECDKY